MLSSFRSFYEQMNLIRQGLRLGVYVAICKNVKSLLLVIIKSFAFKKMQYLTLHDCVLFPSLIENPEVPAFAPLAALEIFSAPLSSGAGGRDAGGADAGEIGADIFFCFKDLQLLLSLLTMPL